MNASQPILTLKDVRYVWPGDGPFQLEVGDFSVTQAETVLLLGKSGAGKSTLLSLVCGTIQARSGTVMVAGSELAMLSSGARDAFRAENIGVIFQQFNLLPYATVLDNILLPLQFAPDRRARVSKPRSAAQELCQDLGLSPDMILAKAGTLSVGQQQRVAAARALIGAPQLIIADEPTSALDAATQEMFLALLFEQVRRAGSSLLMVSHDKRLAKHFDRCVQMSDITTDLKGAL